MNSNIEVFPGFQDACLRLTKAPGYRLSRRESQILVMLFKEFTIYKIAEILGRERCTIYKHLENARIKMNCNSLLSLGAKLSCI
jgi:DNA-binding CsgD family transcriptional regulator